MSTVPALPPGQSKAMTSATPQVALVQTLLDDMRYEVVDGQVVDKRMGTFETGIASLLVEILGPFVRANRLGQCLHEMLFRIDVAEDLQRRPDVAFISNAPPGRSTDGRRRQQAGTWSLTLRSRSSARATRHSRSSRRFTSISPPE